MPEGYYETTNNAEETGNIVDADTWETYGDVTLIRETDYVECVGPANLAYDVLNVNGINCATPSIGGDLADLDIKRMDARTVVNLSLIHYSAMNGGGFYEAMVNPAGSVEFVEVGGDSGKITDIYYEVQAGSYKDDATAVMVTGGQPLVTRRPLQWKPIWGDNPTRIYSMKDMFENCNREAFSRYATIAFKDPQLDTAYNDGIDNLYEIDDSNPWDTILGYVIYKEPPKNLVTKDTKIQYAEQTSIPIMIGTEEAGAGNGPYMGTLQRLTTYDPEIFAASCYTEGDEVQSSDGVKVNLPSDLRYENVRGIETDLLLGVSSVFLVGFEIQGLVARPKDDGESLVAMNEDNSTLMAAIQTQRKTSTKLTEGRDYAVAYAEDNGQRIPYIVFGKDVRPNDVYSYGQDTTYLIDPTCEYAALHPDGVLDTSYEGTIFPHSKLKGILVTEIWVYADIATPCIVVEDPDGTTQDPPEPRCLEIAQNLKYMVAPIVVEEKPAPIGYRGPSGSRNINLLPLHDNDPTTVEDFEDTDLEEAMDEMQGGGMALTYSFLKDDSYDTAQDLVKAMAETLYDYMNSDVIETVYTCGPECNPQLGGAGLSNGVVNSIRYSYSDQGSYTVSVTEGAPMVGGLAQVDGGPTAKMNEDLGATGTVIDSVGDNITFKVRIDGFGDRWAVSMTHGIIRTGDKVQVTVHNCPIEQ